MARLLHDFQVEFDEPTPGVETLEEGFFAATGREFEAEGDEDDIPRIARPSEADLPGHLANADAAVRRTPPSIIRPPASGQKPADFQLTYALDFLHGKVSPPPTKSAQAN